MPTHRLIERSAARRAARLELFGNAGRRRADAVRRRGTRVQLERDYLDGLDVGDREAHRIAGTAAAHGLTLWLVGDAYQVEAPGAMFTFSTRQALREWLTGRL